MLAAFLAGEVKQNMRISSGEVARTATLPPWVTAMDTSPRGPGCAREGTGPPGATELAEERGVA